MKWDERVSVEREMPRVIDSAWHYSWYWKTTESGYHYSLEGFRQALMDGLRLRAEKQAHIDRLDRLLPKIREIIGEEERYLEEDSRPCPTPPK